jgi:hypothetical protein
VELTVRTRRARAATTWAGGPGAVSCFCNLCRSVDPFLSRVARARPCAATRGRVGQVGHCAAAPGINAAGGGGRGGGGRGWGFGLDCSEPGGSIDTLRGARATPPPHRRPPPAGRDHARRARAGRRGIGGGGRAGGPRARHPPAPACTSFNWRPGPHHTPAPGPFPAPPRRLPAQIRPRGPPKPSPDPPQPWPPSRATTTWARAPRTCCWAAARGCTSSTSGCRSRPRPRTASRWRWARSTRVTRRT